MTGTLGYSGQEKDLKTPSSTIHPLNTGRDHILEEALSEELIPASCKFPFLPNANQTKHCRYHRNYGRNTEECMALKEKIEELIQARQLQRYFARIEDKSYGRPRKRSLRERNPRERSPAIREGRARSK